MGGSEAALRHLSRIIPAAAAACFALAALASAPAHAEEFLQVRVNRAGGDMTFLVPRRAVASLSRMSSGTTVSVGTLKGKDVRLSLDRIARSLDALPSSQKETLVLSRPSDLGEVRLYARSVLRDVPAREPSPALLNFQLHRKGEGGDTRLVFPLAGAGLIAEALSGLFGVQVGSDVTPFLENCIRAARELGSGPLLTVVGSDAEVNVSVQ